MAINKINRVVIHDDLLEELDGMATKLELQNTKEELKNTMNEIYQGISWKLPVSTFDDLRTTYPNAEDGWTSTVIDIVGDTNVTYQYNLETDTWFPTSINALPLATSEVDGLMGQADKEKLNTVERDAQKNLSASEVLEQIKTVDGEGSGLDADLFQGKIPDDFAKESHDHNGLYYNKTESTILLNGKAPKNHLHSKEDIVDFEHEHDANDITGLPTKVSDLENDKGYITSDDLGDIGNGGNVGQGNMTKATYDRNDNGIVDRAEVADSVDWDNVQNKPALQDLDIHMEDIAQQEGRHGIRHWDGKLDIKVGGEWIEFENSNQAPIGNVSNLWVKEDNSFVTLQWRDPADASTFKWEGTKILRKVGSYPEDENDGELIIDNKIRNQYQSKGFVDSGLTNDTEYFYMAFPYAVDGLVIKDVINRISATPTEIDPTTWAGVQRIVREGLANKFFSIGDQIVSNYGDGQITWEIIGIDVDTPADSRYTHSMTLQTKDCLHDIQFDSIEPSNPNSDRRGHGNNRYAHSAVKQWLNSSESAFVWQSQHQYDSKPDADPELYNGAGFLNKLDPQLTVVLGAVDKDVDLNKNVDGGEQESFSDKVFLLSRKEVDLGEEGDTTDDFIYPFYKGKGNANRIKILNTSPSTWWLRSPDVSTSNIVRVVLSDGSLERSGARRRYRLSPACTIV